MAVLLLADPAAVQADAIGVETIVIAMHLHEETLELGERYPRRLDRRGRFILMPGLEAYYDLALEDGPLGIDHLRTTFGQYRDSMDKRSGYLAMMARWENTLTDNWDWGIYLGPMLLFRESWRDIEGYNDDRFYSESEKFMPGYQYVWYPGGKLELLYHWNSDTQAVLSLVPGLPFVLVHYAGMRWSF